MELLRNKREHDLERELRSHLELEAAEQQENGLSSEDARYAARRAFGNTTIIKESVRETWPRASLERFWRNLRYSVRMLRKAPAFTVVALLSLALGIGANSAVFSAIDAILLRPLPFPNSDQLMLLHQKDRKRKNPKNFVAPPRLEDWNRLNSTFQAISGWYIQDASETSGSLPEKVTEALVAPRFLQVWGIFPALGRDFTRQEERFGGPAAVLISDRLWRRRFHVDANAVGKRLRIEKRSYTIAGIMPASFSFPDRDVDAWTPSPMDAPYAQSRDSAWFTVIGRLKPGVTVAQARADLTNVQVQLGRQFPRTDAEIGVDIQPLKETTVAGIRRSLWVLFGSVSLVLLIACTNVAALLLARTTEREREISVRFSLGASRAVVIAQLLTESVVLALAGAGLGLFVAGIASKMLRSVAKSFPRVQEITLDWGIVLYTLACAVLAALIFGLFPAIRGTRRSISNQLASASRTQVSTRNPLQWLLVGVQVSLAATLLVGAGLLLRSFQELGRVSPGFDFTHVLILRISANWGESGDYRKLMQRIDRTLDELRALPGVRSAAVSGMLPGIPGNVQTDVQLEGHPETEGKIVADSRFVSDGYFATMKIPLLAGEDCTPSLDAHSVVVNRSFANKYLSGSRGIGQHVQLTSNLSLPPAEIKAIVADAREQGLNREPEPIVYWCLNAPYPSPYFLLRTQGDPLSMGEAVRRKIHQIEPARSVFDISPLEQHLSDRFAENRFRTILLTTFALTALSLACIGLYGTMSYFVTVRKREIGLRLALGGARAQIIKHFLYKGLATAFIGCITGLCLAIAFERALAGMLYGVSPTDAETFFSVLFVILGVALLASLLPALRAARVEPMQVLREE